MEATTIFKAHILGLRLGLYRDKGKDNGTYHNIIGLSIGVNTGVV